MIKNQHLLSQFMKENKLEYDKPFYIVTPYNKIKSIIRKNGILEQWMQKSSIFEWTEVSFIELCFLMFSKDYHILNIMWKPKKGEKYLVYDKKGLLRLRTNNESLEDKMFFLVGNCFQTEEDAIYNKDKILQILKREDVFIDIVN